MLADLSCDHANWFDALCRVIDARDPSHLAGPIGERLISAAAIFAAVVLAGWVVRRAARVTMQRSSADRQVQALARNLITVLTYVLATLSALVVAGVDIAVLVTAAGVGTIAIGLAFQDVLRNLFAGIWLLLEQPFRLGDSITVADQSGVVQNVTLRTTTLRSGDGRLVVLPNLLVFSSAVVNASRFDMRRLTVSVRLPAGADLEQAMRDARAALSAAKEIADRPAVSLQPQLDGEAMVLHCHLWVDQRATDPDAVLADAASRLWNVGHVEASESAQPAPQPR